MAIVHCKIERCKYRSKRKSSKWRYKDGSPIYGCTKKTIVVLINSDPDGDVYDLLGEDGMSTCGNYEPIGEE